MLQPTIYSRAVYFLSVKDGCLKKRKRVKKCIYLKHLSL